MKSTTVIGFQDFATQLLQWHREQNTRSMPWKGIKNAYFIWLSEIILQQTRVEQGMAYYEKFIQLFPTIADLAMADEQRVFNAWQGLGYYSRCRNLIKTARLVHQQYGGRFPETFMELRQLPGIGDYTAAAIASFAFRLPHAAVDGNVIRILSRYLGSALDPASQKGKTFFTEWANRFLPPKHPDLFNQAMMDLGATICTPKHPNCASCPLQASCYAYLHQAAADFPVKKKKNPLKVRHFHFGIMEHQGNFGLVKRTAGDVWADLYTPWMLESEGESCKWPESIALKQAPVVLEKQVLSHQKIWGYFYQVKTPSAKFINAEGIIWVPCSNLKHFTFPRMVLAFMKNSGYL